MTFTKASAGCAGGRASSSSRVPLLHGEVRDRAPRLRSRGAWQGPAPQGDELRPAARMKAEDPAHLRRSGASVRNYFEKAEHQKGVTGENLLLMLERRLDNLVYRLGSPRHAGRRAGSSATATSWWAAAPWTSVLSGAGGRRDQRAIQEPRHDRDQGIARCGIRAGHAELADLDRRR